MAEYKSTVYRLFSDKRPPKKPIANPTVNAFDEAVEESKDKGRASYKKQAAKEADYQRRVAEIDRKRAERIVKCRESATRFETRSEFNKGAGADYSYAYNHGILDEICAHMRPPWSKMICYHT